MSCDLTAFGDRTRVSRVTVIARTRDCSHITSVIGGNNCDGIQELLVNKTRQCRSSLTTIGTCRSTPYRLLLRSTTEPLISPQVVARDITTLTSRSTITIILPTGSAVCRISSTRRLYHVPHQRRLCRTRAPRSFLDAAVTETCTLTLSSTSFAPASSLSIIRHCYPSTAVTVIVNSRRGLGLAAPTSVSLVRGVLDGHRRR